MICHHHQVGTEFQNLGIEHIQILTGYQRVYFEPFGVLANHIQGAHTDGSG
jgi:hypothetical protein